MVITNIIIIQEPTNIITLYENGVSVVKTGTVSSNSFGIDYNKHIKHVAVFSTNTQINPSCYNMKHRVVITNVDATDTSGIYVVLSDSPIPSGTDYTLVYVNFFKNGVPNLLDKIFKSPVKKLRFFPEYTEIDFFNKFDKVIIAPDCKINTVSNTVKICNIIPTFIFVLRNNSKGKKVSAGTIACPKYNEYSKSIFKTPVNEVISVKFSNTKIWSRPDSELTTCYNDHRLKFLNDVEIMYSGNNELLEKINDNSQQYKCEYCDMFEYDEVTTNVIVNDTDKRFTIKLDTFISNFNNNIVGVFNDFLTDKIVIVLPTTPTEFGKYYVYKNKINITNVLSGIILILSNIN